MEKKDLKFSYCKILWNEICRKKSIWIILIIAVVGLFLVAWLNKKYNWEEEHHVLEALGTLFNNVAFGYIAGFIFYIFSDLHPYCRRKYNAESRVLALLDTRLKFEMESVIGAGAYDVRNDKDAFYLRLINLLVDNNNPGNHPFKSINEAKHLSPIRLNKSSYNSFLFDLKKSGKSAKFLIHNYSEFLSFEFRDVLLNFIDLESEIIPDICVDNNNDIWLSGTNLCYYVERFVDTKFEVDKMIDDICKTK